MIGGRGKEEERKSEDKDGMSNERKTKIWREYRPKKISPISSGMP